MMLRLCGTTAGLPLELVLLDFSRTNFSSARASMLQAYRTFKTEQQIMVQRYLSPLYRWKIQTWIAQGKLPKNPQSTKHRFVGQGWSYLDPMKEAQATQLQIDMGTLTIGEALAAQGHDFETWLMQRKTELEEMKQAGIPAMHHQMMQQYTPTASVAPVDDDSDDEPDDIDDTEDEDLEGAEDE